MEASDFFKVTKSALATLILLLENDQPLFQAPVLAHYFLSI